MKNSFQVLRKIPLKNRKKALIVKEKSLNQKITVQIADNSLDLGPGFDVVFNADQSKVKSLLNNLAQNLGND